MPTLKLQGGLGNQMFQYALAYRLSREYGEDIILDPVFLESRFIGASWTFREFELDVFGIKKTYRPLPYLQRKWIHPKIIEIWDRIVFFRSYTKEHRNTFVNHFPRNAYLDGTFQSYRHFERYNDEIRKLFTVITTPSPENQTILEEIQKAGKNAVSIHVRRGDYITLEGASKWHGVCSLDYYEKAINIIKEIVINPVFFVFSDDIPWCKKFLPLPQDAHSVFVDNNTGAGYEDLRLMYSCSHHIIANSSFSWWGAYLGRNPDKKVIAPKKWFQNNPIDTSNLFPPTWTLL